MEESDEKTIWGLARLNDFSRAGSATNNQWLVIEIMYFIYILYSDSFDRYYVGMSHNVLERLRAHNRGKTKSTKAFIPWGIVHTEEFETRVLARKREKYLKSAAGRRWRKNNLGD
ncbi:GIY-YIG nuclease family protein [Xanthomarina sp. F1114]|uniref:GIY-YIG nuclease family protein n=1 Tax=Xanthomarina sp. F1114 TaxID=2996019 RepID=UPI00225E4223|nr:GIY-YIG nuclease family protein [Xanthomarina sp. F1114]MCX7546506.1 GIY-YIG nuclease family protein [Xanthomarina sp. F1114]